MQLSNERKVSDMRSAYADTLIEVGTKDKNIVCVGADTTDSLKTKKFGEKFPTRLYNVGIAEANLVSIAAGLSIAGKIVFASTYAAFLPGRCLDQIRNTICYPFLNVKLVVSHAGLTVGPDGASHQQIEDISIMRTIPNMRVIVPCDALSVKYLIPSIATCTGPFYMRLARPASDIVYDGSTNFFEVGKGNILRDGCDATIVSCGLMVMQSLKAAEILRTEYGLSCRVIDMYSIKPIDEQIIYQAALETGLLVTVEEHSTIGGLGSAVSEVVCEKHPVYVRKIGINDTFGESARDEEIDSLLDKYGLTSGHIVEAVIGARRKSKN
ncbi:MAG TPA: transketolase family protein [Nitrososphaeraceae archaeon]